MVEKKGSKNVKKASKGKKKAQNNSKISIVIALIVIIVIAVAAVLIVKNINSQKNAEEGSGQGQTQFYREEDGTKINTSKKLSETKEFEGLEISNATLTEFEDNSSFIATLTNKTDAVSGEFFLDLKFVDKDNNEIATISCYVDRVEPGQSVELNAAATANLANSYDYTIAKQ